MIIDVHGHYTTAPAALGAWRDLQIAGLKDPSKAPASLRRQLDENRSSQEEQQRFIQQQEQEKSRINQRFDAELVPLRALWSAAAAAAAPTGR